jgi:uncharacterized membrane protein YagU involved in acid resistance
MNTTDAAHDASSPGQPRAFETILYGGLAIGLGDLIFAFTFYWLILGGRPVRIFQSVAAGVLGRETAIAGGVKTFLFGIFMHFVVATCIAVVYFLFTRVLPLLLRHPVVSGLLYGVAAYFGMKYLVLPLSAIGRPGTIPRLPILISEILGHALLVGLPVALIAARSAKNNKNDYSSPGLEPSPSGI